MTERPNDEEEEENPKEILARELGRTPELRAKRDLAHRFADAFRAERVSNGFDVLIQRALGVKQ